MSNTDKQQFAGAKVLICDDDPTYLMLMGDTLTAQGFEVIEAKDGNQALSQYFTHRPDIVLMDVEMPNMTGYEVCKRIRADEQGQETPVLMITGADDYDSISRAYEIGATDFLPKPIRWPMIAHRVRYMLRSRDAIQNFRSSEKKLRHLAYYDTLTNLPNRQSFTEHLEKIVQLAERGDYHVAVLFIDLDRFKRINDTLGHEFGDKVLKSVAQTLENCVRSSDMLARQIDSTRSTEVARLGGDEFTVFLSKVDKVDSIAKVAQRIIDAISQPIRLEQFEVTVTPSIGISVYPGDGQDCSSLMKNADVAMYYAKNEGRRCYKFYSESLNRQALEHLQLEQDLRSAIDNNQFELYYQPQVDLASQSIVGVEALIRWNHPTLGLVSPASFIPISEESGLIIEIGEWVLSTACAHAQEWREAGHTDLKVSVNLSSLQFKQGSIADLVKERLRATGLPPECLVLELTESAIMTDVEENIVRLKQIKDMGVAIAIDDFGTGYSSLNYLKKFPINTLKIDRSFIIDIADNSDDFAIVEMIVALANTLNLDTVAEGVETSEQLEVMRTFKCNVIQGYYYSPPVDQQTLLSVLKDGV